MMEAEIIEAVDEVGTEAVDEVDTVAIGAEEADHRTGEDHESMTQ